MAEQKLTAQQRAQLFGASTRQHFQMLEKKTVSGGAQLLTFRLPKARFVQSIKLYVEGTYTLTHASSTSKSIGKLDIYKALRRVSVDYNNGFMPIVCSGEELAMVNMLYPNPEMVYAANGTGTLCNCNTTLTASTTGADNTFSFMLDMPLTLNYRDPVGLVLAQNSETSIDINVDIANPVDIIKAATGYTAEFSTLSITPMVMSFSIPSDSRAFPDMSVLKIVDSKNEPIVQGQNYIKLPVGMIYRKMILKFEKTDGTAMSDSDITSNIELVLNTADIPYSIHPTMLRLVDKQMLGEEMPTGVYFFSFDYQGICGYGGSRDYIDAERITEFAVRFHSGCAGKLTVVSEKLTRLIGA